MQVQTGVPGRVAVHLAAMQPLLEAAARLHLEVRRSRGLTVLWATRAWQVTGHTRRMLLAGLDAAALRTSCGTLLYIQASIRIYMYT